MAKKLVVAVDFGTTRTAYATTQQGLAEDDIEVGLPTGASKLSPYDSKTPSNVLIDESGQRVLAYGYAAHEKYRNKPSERWMFFRWFKMALHDSSSQDPLVEALNGRSLKLSVILAKALEFVKDSVVKKLNDEKGLHVSAKDLLWVVTVPAIWNDWAKQMMRKAVFDAGMISQVRSKNLVIALEPECACISVQMEKIQGALQHVGQKILILDCGGGTVDITAHEVEGTDPLRLRELMPPTGGPFGATRVDERFLDFFEALVGVRAFQKLKQSQAFLSLSRSWEERKILFTGEEKDDDPEWCANLSIGEVVLHLDLQGQLEDLVAEWNNENPQRRAEALGDANVALSFDLMMSFFDGPIYNIIDRLDSMMEENRIALRGLSYVVIAGGFGHSALLQKRIREHFKKTDVTVVVSRHPDLAIVKGAAAFGARPSVVGSRKAKFTYGIECCTEFTSSDPRHLSNEHKKYMGKTDKWLLDIFNVHGRIGDDIPVGTKSERRDYRPLTREQDKLTFHVLVTKAREVLMRDEPGIRTLGSWTVGLDMSVPYEDRKYDVEFVFGETETFCTCYKKIGSTSVQVNEMEVEFPSDMHWNSPSLL